MDKFVDLVLPVSPGATVLVGVSLLFEALSGGVELEGPEEVVGDLEVGSAGCDLVDEVLHTDDAGLAELGINEFVVGEGDSALVDLAVSSSVDEIGDGLLGRVSISNVWLDLSHHVDGGLVQSDEDTVVELSQSQKLHDLLGTRGQFVDTKQIKLISNTPRMSLLPSAII